MKTKIQVPFTDLAGHHAPLKRELMAAIEEVIDSGSFAGGSFVEAFEEDFARYCGTRYAVGVGSGTDALWLSLSALGIGPGDEVITVPSTFIATVEAISRTGARPVFVDIDPETYTLDPTKIGAAVTHRTKAILPVHLYGRMADMDGIMTVANVHGLHVVEDAAQAHGAEHRGRCAGSIGAAGCFSFYPGKNLGAFGEAGAVVTDDARIAKSLRMLREHGQSQRNVHPVLGWNCRMDGIQAAVLRVKLGKLDANNERRRQHAARYSRVLRGVPNLILPRLAEFREDVHHLYVVRVPDRENFIARLNAKGVGSAVHYPTPVHLQAAYSHLGYRPGSFPIAEKCAAGFVSLPMHADLTPAQIDRVIEAVIDAAGAVIAA